MTVAEVATELGALSEAVAPPLPEEGPARERQQEMIEPMLEAFTLIDSQHGSNVYNKRCL